MLSLAYRTIDLLRHHRRRKLWSPDHAIGRRGEDLAHRYLRKRGYVIVGRNYRARSGAAELDLIAWDGDRLVFVEVKTRNTEEFGAPDRAVDPVKREHLFRAAREYTRRTGVGWDRVRFDVVGIVLAGEAAIHHYRDVFPIAAELQ